MAEQSIPASAWCATNCALRLVNTRFIGRVEQSLVVLRVLQTNLVDDAQMRQVSKLAMAVHSVANQAALLEIRSLRVGTTLRQRWLWQYKASVMR